MPLMLDVTYQRLPRIFASRVPAWRRLLALADAAAVKLTTLWSGFFSDARGSVRLEALARTLEAPNILEAQALVSQTWHMEVEVPARRLLPVLATETITDAARLMEPTVSRLVGQPVTYTTGLPETAQWVNTFVGTQIRDITATTRQAVQQVLRAGWNAGTAPRPLARQIRDVIGLTPRQAQTIERLRGQLQAQGKTVAQVQRSVEQATTKALRYRAETIARTESLTLANRGSFETTTQAVRRGYIDEQRLRRFWLVTEGKNTCAECLAIPAMNPDGVGLYEEFQTGQGTLLFPPLHPNCRCTVTTNVVL
jgi:hypothetical protein